MARQKFHGKPGLIREEGPKIAPYWGRSCGACTNVTTWCWRASWPFTQFVGGGCLWIWASWCLNSAWERKPPQWVTQEVVTGQEEGSGRYWRGENYLGGWELRSLLWQEQGFHYVKAIPLIWVSLCYCRIMWGFFCCCKHINTNIYSILSNLFCRWEGNFCNKAQIKLNLFLKESAMSWTILSTSAEKWI